MILIKRTFTLLTLVIFGAYGSLLAQSNTEGLFLNIGIASSSHSSDLRVENTNLDVFDGDRGAGLNLKAGYGFSPLFTLYVGYHIAGMERDGTDIPFWNGDDEYALSLFELGGRFTFLDNNSSFRPYADVALSSVVAVFDDDPETSAKGGAISLGGGAQYFINEIFAVDANLMLSPGAFNDVVFFDNDAGVDDDKGFFITRLSLGLNVYPFQ
ncbi:outer membrane beta-barrel protein [Tunicatimonas pelagia]|uniref:outer membrane beta-barrel protein n=1 Tax=Tunicatimonas pelagia TaxID=931531 RepID=UPI002664F12F|nr:outer membrane beta-barrel protein [Tunicatimonas pelagia]WKN44987.1 outer membrane beta-barrel protein [Tunicatimonas pelagia]